MSARSRKSATSSSCRRLRSAQLEEQLVKKRQAEYERLNFWNNNSTYFKTWEFHASLHSNWADFDSSDHQRKVEELKKKQERLEERRKKLKKLLEDEEAALEEELKNKKKKPVLLEDLNAANVELLLKEEEARRRERDLKMHHHWRQNQPSIRDFERKQHSDHVKLSWLHQLVAKRKEREEEEMKMIEDMKQLQRLQMEREQREKELIEERKRTEMELKNFLENQIKLAKCKEQQQAILESEGLETLRIQNELEELIEERRKLEDRRKRIDLSLFHKKQYQILLKRRAREVFENLDYDRKFLERIANEKKYESHLNAERVAKLKRDLEIAREIYKKQADIEKLREFQAEHLFDEEAKKIYEKQEAQWKSESDARQKLLLDVLIGLQKQIKDKLVDNLKVREEIRKEHELILENLELTKKELKDCQEKAKKALENWKKDLDQQILEKKLEVYQKKKKEEEDKENLLKAKKEEEEKLRQELMKMYVSGYQPKSNGRKNITWM